MCLWGTVSVLCDGGHECECEFTDVLTCIDLLVDLWTCLCALDEDQHGTGRSQKLLNQHQSSSLWKCQIFIANHCQSQIQSFKISRATKKPWSSNIQRQQSSYSFFLLKTDTWRSIFLINRGLTNLQRRRRFLRWGWHYVWSGKTHWRLHTAPLGTADPHSWWGRYWRHEQHLNTNKSKGSFTFTAATVID